MAHQEMMKSLRNDQPHHRICDSEVITRPSSGTFEPIRPDHVPQPSTLESLEIASDSLQQDVESSNMESLCAVLGSFLILFSRFMQTLGTLQAYLELHQLSEYSSRDIGWIAGVFTSLALFLGVQIGPVFDTFGDAFLAPLGCVLYIPVFFLLAQCEKYWQFMLTLGVLGGIGAGIFSVVGVGVIGNRFVRRRGIAMGCALSGSSIGGVVMPLMLRSLLPKVGWAWSMRAVAFLIAFASIGGVMCLRRLSPRRRSAARYSGVALNFSVFTSGCFVFVTLGLAALEFAVFGMFSLLPTYAIKSSFSSDTGFLLLAIANATSCMGRLIPGIAGDRIGHFNMLLCMILFTAVCTAIILVPFGSSSLGAIYAFAAIWGFGSGSFISLTPV
ncbi:hypothetical protein E8E14_000637 [Neopestalotiopsis sp. 37M]|nr:hypothetical protein E8E14_000637 [Neopestalotiopsis sp. 37M]